MLTLKIGVAFGVLHGAGTDARPRACPSRFSRGRGTGAGTGRPTHGTERQSNLASAPGPAFLIEVDNRTIVAIVAYGKVNVMAVTIALDDDPVAVAMAHHRRAAPALLAVERVALIGREGRRSISVLKDSSS